jgi:hypothetical protein
MTEVIIPALNEGPTIRRIVETCLEVPSITAVHVMVDAKTTDNTASAATMRGAYVNTGHGMTGKGQLIQYIIGNLDTPRVMLCDGDYTRFTPHIAEEASAASLHYQDTMRIVVPRIPTGAQWHVGGAPFPFNTHAWGVNSGLRSFPIYLVNDLVLHGYLVETQLNQAAETRGVKIEKLYETSFIQPLRFTERRLEAMEADRQWGIANGVLRG